MTTIRKVVIELTLLLEEGEQDRLMQMSLDQIADEMDEGCFIGSFSITSDAIVAASDLKAHSLRPSAPVPAPRPSPSQSGQTPFAISRASIARAFIITSSPRVSG